MCMHRHTAPHRVKPGLNVKNTKVQKYKSENMGEGYNQMFENLYEPQLITYKQV